MRFSKANGYHFNPIPDCIKEATKLELALCSLNMVNTYLYTATPLSGQRYQYQAIVYENDVDNFSAKVLPRFPENCRYIFLKNQKLNINKPSHFKINIHRIKEILKFY